MATVARFGLFVSIVVVGAWLFVSIIIAAVVMPTPNWIVNFKPITSLSRGCPKGQFGHFGPPGGGKGDSFGVGAAPRGSLGILAPPGGQRGQFCHGPKYFNMLLP